ncbi:unnamed protein product, partial [Mesorhabditis spiculigera]
MASSCRTGFFLEKEEEEEDEGQLMDYYKYRRLHDTPDDDDLEPTPSTSQYDLNTQIVDGSTSSTESDGDEDFDPFLADNPPQETRREFLTRQYRNIVHFFVEDWFLSGVLGVITAVLSITTDVGIEYLQHFKIVSYEYFKTTSVYSGFAAWVLFLVICVSIAGLICHGISKQAVGSGIPEVKVIMAGFAMKNYLTFRTLVAKILALVFTLGSCLPVGKE